MCVSFHLLLVGAQPGTAAF